MFDKRIAHKVQNDIKIH